jgi:hypothetical protein
MDRRGVRGDHDVLVVVFAPGPWASREPGGIGTCWPLIAPQCLLQV